MLGSIKIKEQKYDVRKPKVKDIKGLDLTNSDGVMELSKRCVLGLSPAELDECELAVLLDVLKLVQGYLEKKL